MRGLTLLVLAAAVANEVDAFLLNSRSRLVASQASFGTVCRQTAPDTETAEETETDDVTCYIVNDEEIIEDKADPQVVCTSEPDE